MNEYIINYLEYQEAPETTAKTYGNTLNEFVKWFELNYNEFNSNFKNITVKHINKYLLWLSSKENSSATKKRKLSTLKSFFAYLREEGHINSNPVDINTSKKIKSVYEDNENKVRKYFDVSEIQLLLSNIGDNKRNNAMIQLYLNTGLRLSELVSLNVGSVQNDTLVVVGKGKKERTIYLNSYIKEILDDYLDELDYKSSNSPLFISYFGTRINVRTVQKIISDIEKKVGLKTGVHLLRHTFATYMLQEGNADIVDIQTLLGHSDIRTTQLYAKVSEKKLRNIINQNPIRLST